MKSLKEKINTTEFEIIKSQELWAQNVIEIGNLYTKTRIIKQEQVFLLNNFMLLIYVKFYLSLH